MQKWNWILIWILLLCILFISSMFFKTQEEKSESFEIQHQKPEIHMLVITLKHENRLENIRKQQEKIAGYPIMLFDAVKGDDLNLDVLVSEKILDPLFVGDKFRKREIGCYLSHYNICKKIRDEKWEGYTIVFEDDFGIKPDFIEQIYTLLETIHQKNIDFDVLYLANSSNNKGEPLMDNLYEVDRQNNLWGTYALLWNNAKIDNVIEHMGYINCPVDVKLQEIIRSDTVKAFVVFPYLVEHDWDNKSTIRDGTVENFSSSLSFTVL